MISYIGVSSVIADSKTARSVVQNKTNVMYVLCSMIGAMHTLFYDAKKQRSNSISTTGR